MARRTEGYSGADLELLCREAAMRPVRRLMTRLQDVAPAPPPPARSGGVHRAGLGRVAALPPESCDVEGLLRNDPVSNEDLFAALSTTKPSSDGNMSK